MMTILRMQRGHPKLPSNLPPPGEPRLSSFGHCGLSSPVPLALPHFSERSSTFFRSFSFLDVVYLPMEQRAKLKGTEGAQ